MKLIRQYPLEEKDLALFEYEGVWLPINDKMAFFYMCNALPGEQTIVKLSFDQSGELVSHASYPIEGKIVLPWQWRVVSENDATYLSVAKDDFCICAEDGTCKVVEGVYHEPECCDTKTYVFEDVAISRKGSRGYRGKSVSTGKTLWERSGKGYLYTEMLPYGDQVIFGTAEAGGKLYCIDPATGESVYEVDTGGTIHYLIEGKYIYCLRLMKNSALLKIDLDSGEVVREVPLPGKAIHCSTIGKMGNLIYTVTFLHYEKDVKDPIVCVIEES